ncbi:MAG TPA: protein kinase [Blastocatellia bacterium]|nr:protein kinase [Blastocatellia bacterium]
MKSCPQCGKTFEDTFRVCPHDGVALLEASPAASDPMIGRLLAGRFRLTKKLGQGGMGTVYKAVHTEMDRTCAIKVLLASAADSEAAVARFKREARMASRIENPHAVTIYDFGQAEGGLLYLAMEFIDGRSLSQVMEKEWPLGVDRVVNITAQIAEALSAAHSLGIVHRDLKPDNIMITEKGDDREYVKVLDFGIAKSLVESEADKVTRTGFVLGTPIYMSPEQIAGEPIDARSDIYSLALIVYEMLSSRLPFEGDNTQAIMYKRVMSAPIPLRQAASSISDSIERVVMDGLARKSADRLASAIDFAAALSKAANIVTRNIGERGTEQMSGGPAGRKTTPVHGHETIVSGSGFDAMPGASAGHPHGFTDHPTVPSQQVPPAPNQQYGAGPREQARPMAGGARFGQQQAAAPQYPPPTRLAPPGYDQQTAVPASSKMTGIIIAVAAAVILALGAAGYFIFSRLSPAQPAAQTAQTETAAPAPQPADATSTKPPDQQASDYFAQGKKYQEQAYLLASAGAKNDSVEESRKAVEQYRRAVAIKPKFPEAHENLAVALYNSGQLEAAADQYRIAIDQYTELFGKPTDQVYTNYGLALFDLKRYREASDAFGRALEIDPGDYDLHAHRGFALQNAGDEAAAKEAYQRYLKLAPGGQFAEIVRQILAGRALPPTDSGNN